MTAHAKLGGRSLTDLQPGQTGVVADIAGDASLGARLTAQGLAPGAVLLLVQRAPSFVVELGETTLALEPRVALAIRLESVVEQGDTR